MDEKVARERLTAERAEVRRLLASAQASSAADRSGERGPGDYADFAQPLAAQDFDDSQADAFAGRLAAIDRALRRLDEGSYGLSVRSGDPIPDDRLDADPAAELTVKEASRP